MDNVFIQTSSLYSLVSKSPIQDQVSNCKGTILPYHPGFIYAALEASNDYTVTIFEAKPDFLSITRETMDVSYRKVCTFHILHIIIQTYFRSVSVELLRLPLGVKRMFCNHSQLKLARLIRGFKHRRSAVKARQKQMNLTMR